MGNEQLRGSEGPEVMSNRPREWGIRLSDQWSPGPEGLMSLGEMLLAAGNPATREEEPPPPPEGP
eukprot:10487142-Karenia_brevis.AAC.1